MTTQAITSGIYAERQTLYYWNTGTLAFEVATVPSGSSGGGGAVTVADGADVTQGATTDAEATGNGSVVAILKRIRTLLGGTLTVSTGQTQPLTDTQLRAAVVPVSLPTATVTTLTPLSSVGVNNFPATQPVSIAATVNTNTGLTQPVTDTQLRASAVPVSLATAPTTAVTNAGLTNIDVALSTRLKPADTLAAVTVVTAVTAITNALPIGANKIGTVDIATAAATAKGTQGANAVPTQDLKDAGRNPVHLYMLIPVLTSATDTLQSLTATKAGTTVTATTTPAVVTAGKTFRVTRLAATYIATATSGYGVIRLRFNTAGVVAITSPIAATIAVGSSAPTTANATGYEEATMDEGWEFAAATGVGISVQGFAAVTATAVGYVLASLTGYEY